MSLAVRFTRTLLITVLFAQSAAAQSVTIQPVTPVPVSGPVGLLLLAGLLLAAGVWLLRQRRATAAMIALVAGTTMIGGATFRAQSTATFTNPAGETLPIPVTPLPVGADIAGWQWADFINGTGVSQMISGIVAPTFAQCFPSGLTGTLLPAGTPVSSPCSQGMALAAGATCRMDVDALCRTAATGQLATLTSVAPTSGPSFGPPITLTGTNLTTATSVTFGGLAASGVTVVNATTVTALAPNRAPGVVDVAVLTSRGRATLTNGFTYVSGSTLTAINPTSGSASGGVGLTLTGTGLTGATSVTFDGIPATSVNVVNSTTITAVTPPHAAGIVDVVVDTPSGGATLTNGFTYVTTSVGQPSGGGIIAVLNGGLNNLIAAMGDASTGIEWGGVGTPIGVAQSATDGAANTAAIVTTLGSGGGAYAALLCTNYEVDSQGNTPCQAGNACYNDWFLPAGDNLTATGQLNGLFTNRAAVGGFASALYWSSTEFSANPTILASLQEFATGSQTAAVKNLNARVRCVRAFTP
ncbi:midcut-by-XrtH protein [Mycolicibacterium sp.]|uniref:midcut-by-XrtH protein n=1 Tax=Mycolicibacterium sp. TaxID=2320850 RepID=UPI0037C8CF17